MLSVSERIIPDVFDLQKLVRQTIRSCSYMRLVKAQCLFPKVLKKFVQVKIKNIKQTEQI